MSHQNTTFQQILQFVSRHDFNKSVKNHQGNKSSKGFRCWDQFTAMLFGQLSGQSGLRGIESGLSMNEKNLYHLGISPVKRSTLAYANNKRSHEIYRDLFYTLLGRLHGNRKKHKFKFKNPLYSIDASTIDLCLNLFPWAHFRKTKGGVKMHVKLDHSGYIPDFITMTTAKTHERKEISNIPAKKGDVLVFDRGYNDFELFSNYCREGIYFVSRLKSNAAYEVLLEKDTESYENIGFDRTIKMTGIYTSQKCKQKLRIIKSYDPETDKTILLLTNHFGWSPETIAAIYKDRWQIEIFFKTIKQNLRIKSFFGTSPNAVYTQIWIALIAFLLLKYLANSSSESWTVGMLMAVIPLMLFLKKDIWIWLNKLKPDPGPNRNYCGQMEFSL